RSPRQHPGHRRALPVRPHDGSALSVSGVWGAGNGASREEGTGNREQGTGEDRSALTPRPPLPILGEGEYEKESVPRHAQPVLLPSPRIGRGAGGEGRPRHHPPPALHRAAPRAPGRARVAAGEGEGE